MNTAADMDVNMDVNMEARRILAVSISKLYASRAQRGGLRLHRSLLLSLVMRSARDIYHSSSRDNEPHSGSSFPEEPMDTTSTGEPERTVSEPQPTSPSYQAATEEPEADSESGASEDKENLSPAKQSRKRRGKTSATPDFLPSKRARLEPGEERYAVGCRSGLPESLTSLSLNRVIPAF